MDAFGRVTGGLFLATVFTATVEKGYFYAFAVLALTALIVFRRSPHAAA